MSKEEIIKLLNYLLNKKNQKALSATKIHVLMNALDNKTYKEMSNGILNSRRCKDTGYILWKFLSDEVGYKVEKDTCFEAIEKLYEQYNGKINNDFSTLNLNLKSESFFITGKPINDPHRFYGRHKQIEDILYEIENRHPISNISIQGGKRSGKTSILNFIVHMINSDKGTLMKNHTYIKTSSFSNFKCIYIDFRDPLMINRKTLFEQILLGLQFDIPEEINLNKFISVMKKNIQQPILILLDEISVAFQRCPEFDNIFWDGLRHLSCHFNLAYIFTSSENPKSVAQIHNCTSRFFNTFACVPTLGPFLELEARELISSSPSKFDEKDIDFILQETNCWPHLLQIYCKHYLRNIESNSERNWKDDAERDINYFKG